jgi:hypothetical protein
MHTHYKVQLFPLLVPFREEDISYAECGKPLPEFGNRGLCIVVPLLKSVDNCQVRVAERIVRFGLAIRFCRLLRRGEIACPKLGEREMIDIPGRVVRD